MDSGAPILVAGSHTLLGGALVRRLEESGYSNLVGRREVQGHLDEQSAVESFFALARPSYVFCAAGKTGGIAANQRHPGSLMLDNLQKSTNVIAAAHKYGVRGLVYLASSCSYPRECPQPMREESLLSGPLEPSNQAYALAKLAGIGLCLALRAQFGVRFIPAIPTNYFGPGDAFDPQDSHVIEALIARMHRAKAENRPEVVIWGTGSPRREFMCADDLAGAAIHVMEHFQKEGPINLGGGEDLTIKELAETIQVVVGYEGRLRFDASRPDGMPQKRLDTEKLFALGWRPHREFVDSLRETYAWYLDSREEARSQKEA